MQPLCRSAGGDALLACEQVLHEGDHVPAPPAKVENQGRFVLGHIFLVFLCLQIYVFGFGHGIDSDLRFAEGEPHLF